VSANAIYSSFVYHQDDVDYYIYSPQLPAQSYFISPLSYEKMVMMSYDMFFVNYTLDYCIVVNVDVVSHLSSL
jgi:hypothetical protein